MPALSYNKCWHFYIGCFDQSIFGIMIQGKSNKWK